MNEFLISSCFMDFLLGRCPSLLSPLKLRVHPAVCTTQGAIEDMVGGPLRFPTPSSASRSQLLWGMVSKAHSCLHSQRIALGWWQLSSLGGYRSNPQHTHTCTHEHTHNTHTFPLIPSQQACSVATSRYNSIVWIMLWSSLWVRPKIALKYWSSCLSSPGKWWRSIAELQRDQGTHFKTGSMAACKMSFHVGYWVHVIRY